MAERLRKVPQQLARRRIQLLALLGTLTLVAIGATIAVTALINVAEMVGVPEYAISFFGTSIGTSLPELTVDIAAVRRRA